MSTPVWISHRGLSQRHDENSLEAFKRACEAGYSWLETDLHSTKDNHIILSHDPQVDHISCCSGKIAEMSRMELEKMQQKEGSQFLFLNEFMQEFNDQYWVFDIKPTSAAQTMQILSEIFLNNRILINKIVFLFWNKKQQRIFLNDFPEATCFVREAQCYQAGIASVLRLPILGNIKKNQIYSIIPKISGIPLISKRVVQAFHKRGAQVIGYLPADQAEVQLCIDAGVDYILSNDLPVKN